MRFGPAKSAGSSCDPSHSRAKFPRRSRRTVRSFNLASVVVLKRAPLMLPRETYPAIVTSPLIVRRAAAVDLR